VAILLKYLAFCFRETPLSLSRPQLFESHGYMVVPDQVRKSLELTACQVGTQHIATGRTFLALCARVVYRYI